IIPMAAFSSQRMEYINFTSAYLSSPAVIATKLGVPFIDDLSQVSTKPLGVVKGYFFNERLKEIYPNINIVPVDSIDDGLKKLKDGKIFGYIDNSLVINHKIQKDYANLLAISGKIDIQNQLHVAVNKNDLILYDIFQKLVTSLDDKLKENINNKWVNIKYQNVTDYTLLWQIGIMALILLLGSLYWNSRLRYVNKQLEIQKEKAEEATAAKSNFLANMSHEIRTPMNGILGLIHLALESKENKKQKEYLKFIDSSAKNLLRVLNDILDFSKIESHKLTIQKIDFNIYEIVDSALNLIEHKAQEKNINLSVTYGDNISSSYYGDPVRLFQILSNLLSNAVKFTPKGEVTINISKISDEKVRFEVKDTGIGLSEDQQSKLFQAFSQVDESITRQYEGTGLGLVISKKLVELMNGKIWVESNKGEGSSFIFEIQLLQKEEGDSKLSDNKKLDISRLKNSNILLVEDNSINQMIIKDLLEDKGVNIDIASNGQEAVDIYNINRNKYQLILMDLQMPVMDGIEATKVIREKDSNIPIIALTANALPHHVEATQKAGMNDHLTKPIDVDKFYSTILDYIAER
ncbi:MAG: ATP-binding protein, partial [Campylobacterota bacterium]|nr:ATP-binding protein [Campylobacterota bacterium]